MPANVESMVFTGEKPWHGLGSELKEAFTAEEAIKACPGLDANYKLEELRTKAGIELPGYRAIVRHRNGAKPNVTGVASPSYAILQPRQAFSFFDAVVGQKLAMYHTAGVLGDGERLWMMAKLPGEIRPVKDDVSEKYVLLTTGYNGITATTMMETPIRVVCQNTLNAALEGRETKIRIRHRGDVKAHIMEAQRLLKISLKYYDSLEQSFRVLAGFQYKSAHVKRLFDEVFPVNEERKGDTSKGNAGVRERILFLTEKGRGADLAGVKGTGWGLYNAVTEYVDHFRKTKVAGQKDPSDVQYKESRLTSQWFGLGRNIKDKTFNVLMQMAGRSSKGAAEVTTAN